MTTDTFWQQIAEVLDGECSKCPIYQYAIETDTEFICDKAHGCVGGLTALHKKLQEEEQKK
jgi:hypothetical protein